MIGNYLSSALVTTNRVRRRRADAGRARTKKKDRYPSPAKEEGSGLIGSKKLEGVRALHYGLELVLGAPLSTVAPEGPIPS